MAHGLQIALFVDGRVGALFPGGLILRLECAPGGFAVFHAVVSQGALGMNPPCRRRGEFFGLDGLQLLHGGGGVAPAPLDGGGKRGGAPVVRLAFEHMAGVGERLVEARLGFEIVGQGQPAADVVGVALQRLFVEGDGVAPAAEGGEGDGAQMRQLGRGCLLRGEALDGGEVGQGLFVALHVLQQGGAVEIGVGGVRVALDGGVVGVKRFEVAALGAQHIAQGDPKQGRLRLLAGGVGDHALGRGEIAGAKGDDAVEVPGVGVGRAAAHDLLVEGVGEVRAAGLLMRDAAAQQVFVGFGHGAGARAVQAFGLPAKILSARKSSEILPPPLETSTSKASSHQTCRLHQALG